VPDAWAQAEGAELPAPTAVRFRCGRSLHAAELVARAKGWVPTGRDGIPKKTNSTTCPPAPAATLAKRAPAAFLTVQEAAISSAPSDVVPYTRGRKSVGPSKKVLAEARGLVARGVREITLLARNVKCLFTDRCGTGKLDLAATDLGAEKFEGWRASASHTRIPNDRDDALIDAHGTCAKV